MASDPLLCRQCGSSRLRSHGRIPSSSLFAGQKLDPPWPGGQLLVCKACHLGQRQPLRSAEDYARLYEAASGWVWTRADLRGDQKRVRDWIEAQSGGGDVLDIGCYDGALLAGLSARWRRHGIEPSAAAAQAAGGRGVEVLARSLEALDRADGAESLRDPLPASARRFRIVCAIDVVEHVPDPSAFLARLARRLLPGGALLVSTGDLDAPAWRAAGGAYWYCSFPEHISFLSEPWLNAWARGSGLQIETLERFRYDGPSGGPHRRRLWRRTLRQSLRLAALRLIGRAASPDSLRVLGEPGPFEDHLLVVLRQASPR